MNIGDPNQYNPGQVTAPSAVPGVAPPMDPQMMHRLALIRQIRAQRGQQVPGRGMNGQVQAGMAPPGSTPMNPPNAMQAQLLADQQGQNMWRDPSASSGFSQAYGNQLGNLANQLNLAGQQGQNVPVAGNMGQSNPGYAPPNMPQMSGSAQPQIGQFSRGAMPANPVGPVTTQGRSPRGLPTLPNGLAQRMSIFR